MPQELVIHQPRPNKNEHKRLWELAAELKNKKQNKQTNKKTKKELQCLMWWFSFLPLACSRNTTLPLPSHPSSVPLHMVSGWNHYHITTESRCLGLRNLIIGVRVLSSRSVRIKSRIFGSTWVQISALPFIQWPQARYFTSLCLSSFTCKMRIWIAPPPTYKLAGDI